MSLSNKRRYSEFALGEIQAQILFFCTLFVLGSGCCFAVQHASGAPITPGDQDKELAQLRESGEKFSQAGDYVKAAELYAKACNLCDDDLASHAGYGVALAELGRIDEAIPHLLKVTSSPRATAAAWENLAYAYEKKGQVNEALAALQTALTRKITVERSTRIRDLIENIKKELAKKPSSKDDYFEEATKNHGMRWNKTPVNVYIETSSNLPSFKTDYVGIVKQAFDDWSKAADNKVSVRYVESKSAANINVHWTGDPKELSHLSEGGDLTCSVDKDGMSQATLKILLESGPNYIEKTKDEISDIIYHEVGHALGLLGHSPDAQDIMYYLSSQHAAPAKLSERDIRTIKRLYCEDLGPNEYTLNAEGVKAVGARNREAAIPKFEAALSINPSCEAALNNLLRVEALFSFELTEKQDFVKAHIYANKLLEDAQKYHYAHPLEMVRIKEDLLRRMHENKEAEEIRAKYPKAFSKQ